MRFLVTICAACVAFANPNPVLWRDPGMIEKLDFVGGPGGRDGAPAGPFRFIESDSSGTSPKVVVRDARGREWTVKWGPEVKAETFASRLAWAAGYYVDPVYLVRAGKITGVKNAGRAGRYIDENGRFTDARFERQAGGQYLRTVDWTWKKNPWVGRRELNGLKVVVMLTSNWDNKDGRDDTSNTAILRRGGDWVYLVSDWGATMGKWGNFFTREKWDCNGFRDQTPSFIREVKDGEVRFGFDGKHDDDFKRNIRPSDVRWLMRYLGRVTDAQLRSGLAASGATPHEQRCFARSLRARLNRLRVVARQS